MEKNELKPAGEEKRCLKNTNEGKTSSEQGDAWSKLRADAVPRRGMRTLPALGKAGTAQGSTSESPEHSQITAQSSQPPDTTGKDFLMLSLSLPMSDHNQRQLWRHQPSPAVPSKAGTGELLCSFCCNWTLNDRKSMDRTWQEGV